MRGAAAAAEELRRLARAGEGAAASVGAFHGAIVEAAMASRPLLDLGLLALFRGLVRCRVDDCTGTATGVHRIGNLQVAICPRHLAELATGRLVRRTG